MKTILAIETSCDETACAIARGRVILGESVSSQIEEHVPYGGVVPEIASRKHIEALIPVTAEALSSASMTIREIDAVAVTNGPGLIGALLTGLSYAKGLALALDKPLIPVHHIEAHISANYITHPDLEPPYCCLIVSGGHSHLVRVTDYGKHELIARTRDDAAGEAFDKAARSLGLPYPGGPHLDRLAEKGDDMALLFKRANAGGDYSFSGMKTGLLQALARAKAQGKTILPEDAAASFRKAVVDQLLDVAIPAAAATEVGVLALAGGVACNSLLRSEAARRGGEAGLRVVMPDPKYCTDNAAMVAVAAHYRAEAGAQGDLTVNAVPSMVLPS